MPLKFNYGEEGDLFSYFIVSVGVLVLTPFTLYKWGADRNTKEVDKHAEAHLEALRPIIGKSSWFLAEEQKLKASSSTPVFRRLFIILGWAFLGFVAYRAWLKHEIYVPDFDPFKIFDINRDEYSDFEASKKPIKSLYRKMSKEMHPDILRNKWIRENPDEDGIPEELIEEYNAAWALIVRAHQTLTHEASFNNWIQYGNPDGQLTTEWGIALPKWLFEEGNNLYVLLVYGLIFGIMLPAVVIYQIRQLSQTM